MIRGFVKVTWSRTEPSAAGSPRKVSAATTRAAARASAASAT